MPDEISVDGVEDHRSQHGTDRHGLPFYPKLSLDIPDDADDLSKKVETEWYGGGYAGGLCIKDDVKQRAYYGSPSALESDTFTAVGNDVRGAFEEWLKYEGK